jgi:membrane protease YdiL (CAAX protease family)
VANRHPLVVFYGMALVFSGVIVGGLIAVGLVELFFLATFGPGFAAVTTVGLRDGRSSAWRFVKRSLTWRFGVQWWAAAILLPLVVSLGALGILALRGVTVFDSEFGTALLTAVLLILLLTLLNGIPEEIGWRGFMLPLVQRRHSALVASVGVGVLWGVWHFPVFFIEGTFQDILRNEVGFWLGFAFWTLTSVIFSVTYTWLFNGTAGSALAAGVLHGATNAWIGSGITDLSDSEIVELFTWFVGGWLLIAVILLLTNGAQTLSRSETKVVDYAE